MTNWTATRRIIAKQAQTWSWILFPVKQDSIPIYTALLDISKDEDVHTILKHNMLLTAVQKT